MKTIACLGIKELLRRAIQNQTVEHIEVDEIPECRIILERVARWQRRLALLKRNALQITGKKKK